MNTNIKIVSSTESIDFILLKWIPDTVGFLKMYSFIYLSFQLFEIGERTNENVVVHSSTLIYSLNNNCLTNGGLFLARSGVASHACNIDNLFHPTKMQVTHFYLILRKVFPKQCTRKC